MLKDCPKCGRMETRCDCYELQAQFEELAKPFIPWLVNVEIGLKTKHMANECTKCGRLERKCKCEELQVQFEALAKPLIEWLRDTQDAHTKIVISDSGAELLQGVYRVVKE